METIRVNNWHVYKISENEIQITNGVLCCYAYVSKDFKKLYFDKISCPKTVQKRALQFARKNISSIYN